MGYYSAAAQVIPVVFLVLAFESRLLFQTRTYRGPSDPADPDFDPAMVNPAWPPLLILTAFALFAAEWCALQGLRDGRTSPMKNGVIGMALVLGGVAAIAPVILFQLGLIWRQIEKEPWAGGVVYLCLTAIVAAVLWLVFMGFR